MKSLLICWRIVITVKISTKTIPGGTKRPNHQKPRQCMVMTVDVYMDRRNTFKMELVIVKEESSNQYVLKCQSQSEQRSQTDTGKESLKEEILFTESEEEYGDSRNCNEDQAVDITFFKKKIDYSENRDFQTFSRRGKYNKKTKLRASCRLLKFSNKIEFDDD
jgi:hypothetical protein